MQSMHIASRLFAGVTFLLTAVLNNQLDFALMQLFLIVLALLLYRDGSKRILRALLLLRWLVIPIILLHALFTPGALIVSGLIWPISVEGIQSGLWFSFHLVVIFFAAMFFSIVLTRKEWIEAILKLPMAGHRILPYAMLLDQCWRQVQLMLSAEFSGYRNGRKGLRHLIWRLGSLPSGALKASREVAREVSVNWDQSVEGIVAGRPALAVSSGATVLALSSALLMWLAVIYGGI